MSLTWFLTLTVGAASVALGSTDPGCGGREACTSSATNELATSAVSTELKGGIGNGASSNTAPVLSGSRPSDLATSNTSPGKSAMGLNLGAWSYYQPDQPTIDLMKKASPWLTQCTVKDAYCSDWTAGANGWDTKEQSRLDLDSQGWVKSLPARTDASVKFRSVSTMIFSGGYQPAGRYIVQYKGKGKLEFNGAGLKSRDESVDGRAVVIVRNDSPAGFWITITETDPDDYVRDIKVFPSGGICSNAPLLRVEAESACSQSAGGFISYETLAQRQKFNPSYLRDVTGFRTLRFMDWLRTNVSKVSKWEDRARTTDRSWAGPAGVPIEIAFELAAEAKADPWINIPAGADDDYVKELARLAKTKLPSGFALVVEYSNEPWNEAFPVFKSLFERAKAEWPDEAAQGTSSTIMGLNYYAKRSAQVCQLIKAEFGAAASRVKCVVNTQAAGARSTETVLACPIARRDLGKACSAYFDVVAIAPYFAHYLGNLKYRDEIKRWYAESDGGLSKLFEEIFGRDANGKTVAAPLASYGSGSPEGALGMSRNWIAATKKVADLHGLPLWAYEGGQHMFQFPYDKDEQFFKLIKAANRDPRMGLAYDEMIKDWRALGGQTYAYYTHVDRPSTWGIFGLKEMSRDDLSPKWLSAVKQRDNKNCWWSGC